MAAECAPAKGSCLASECLSLQAFIKDASNSPVNVDSVESGEIADCLIKDGCAAEAYTSGRVELAVMIANAGRLAARSRGELYA